MDDASTPAVLLLNLPQGALGGIDLLSFTTTPRFQGIKNLPPGFHFIFTGSTSTLSIRHGFWIEVQPPTTSSRRQLFIKKWDAATEELHSLPVADELHQRANIGSIWRDNLTPYRQSASKDPAPVAESNDWPQLTDKITAPLLSRILAPAAEATWTLTSSSSAPQDLDTIPGLTAAESRLSSERELHFLPIDLRRTWPLGATGRQRTEYAQDRSWALESLASGVATANDNEADWEHVLGEMQFCFLMVLTLNNYSCLEQWRRILGLVLTCRSAVEKRPGFFQQCLATLRLQLVHCADVEGGLFDFEDEGATFLKRLLVGFAKGLEGLSGVGSGMQDVLDELDDLRDWLALTYGWSFEESFARTGVLELEDGEQVDMDVSAYDEEDEQGEYAPQMVDLSPEQMEILGIKVQPTAEPDHQPKSLTHRPKATEIVQEVESDESDDEFPEAWDPEDLDARY